MLLLASSDEYDLAGQVWDVGIWVEGVGSHCFGLMLSQGMGVMLLGCEGVQCHCRTGSKLFVVQGIV